LSVYQDMLAGISPPKPAPVGHALGEAQVSVQVSEEGGRTTAQITAQMRLEVFEDEWTLVPILPVGTAVTRVAIDGRVIQLVATPEGMAWVTDTAGTYSVSLTYRVDAVRYETGFSLPVPLPQAPSAALTAFLPGTGLDVSVIPAVGVQMSEMKGQTRVSASLPATAAVQITWRSPDERGWVMSRARYEGHLQEDAVVWTGDFDVEVFTAGEVQVPLLPRGVTLSDIRVEGEEAIVLLMDGRFATSVEGRGTHRISVRFQTPVTRGEGPPEVRLQVPEVPVSRFEIVLPGRKEVSVRPVSSVTTSERDGSTVATVYMPMTSSLAFSWVESIPEDVRAEVQANASIYHLVNAEEGVLHVRAIVLYEVTRGETNLFELEVPGSIQVNRIRAPKGGVKDWRLGEGADGEPNRVSVFLDRAVKGEFTFEVQYERLTGAGPEAASRIEVPLLRASEVHRQRGMVALLSGPELGLDPVEDEGISKVGENQLPALVRDRVKRTIAHTYKYFNETPRLIVKAAVPKRKAGKFDAQVDTLVSLGEVAMKGSATIEVNVKSGSIMEMMLRLPAGVNVLGLSGPSLRTHQVKAGEEGQTVEIAFTQEMEGQFRLDLNYERILTEGLAEFSVPTLHVEGAEVEHGRIAVEALTAVEVKATVTQHLSTIDVDELPQQLVLKTTNPILLAYKYVYSDPPYRLALKVTRHEELGVQEAIIERAHYRTLYTRDGMAVTRADFFVRNSRKQFLRIRLPRDSEVWSVFVAGNAEKPALAGEEEPVEGYDRSVLVKMINSTQGFLVEMVYATKVAAQGSMGSVSGRLPRPDMVVTHSRWDLYLPTGFRYQDPDTNMDLVTRGMLVGRDAMQQSVGQMSSRKQQVPGQTPLHLTVPAQGRQFSFEKLYANQPPEGAYFSIRYTSAAGGRLAVFLSVLGAVLLWTGLVSMVSRTFGPNRGLGLVLLVVGVALLAVSLGYFRAGPEPALVTSAVAILLLAVRASWNRWKQRKAKAGTDEA